MKKTLFLLACFSLAGGLTFAQDTAPRDEILPQLLSGLEHKIKAEPEFLDSALTILQKLQNEKKAELQSAFQAGDQELLKKLTQDAELFRTVSSYLNDKKQSKKERSLEYQGNKYQFKSQALMPWLSITRGEDEYFTFPSNKTYLQLTWGNNISGSIHNDISVEYEGKSYLPKYFYAGENTLRNLAWTEAGKKMGSNNGQEKESYLFFDLPEINEKELKKLTFKLGSQSLGGIDLYTRPTFSAHYILKEESPAFKYCKKVAQWKGNKALTKEYPEKDCEAAVKLQFSPEMHQDILDYAKHLYWK